MRLELRWDIEQGFECWDGFCSGPIYKSETEFF